MTDLSWASMDKLSQSILVDKETRKKFIFHFYAGGPIGELSDEDLDKTCFFNLFFQLIKFI